MVCLSCPLHYLTQPGSPHDQVLCFRCPPGEVLDVMANLQDVFAQNTDLCLDGRIICDSIFARRAGGYADVFEGMLASQKVAIKVVRPFELQWKKILRRLWREYLTWSRLSHSNILPCLGYSYDFSPRTGYTLPSLISPWMENGTITTYLESHPDADRMQLLVDVANGLSYLHTREPVIVHGDLRAGNILVSDVGVACLADFGLSRVLHEVKGMTTTSDLSGSLRWMSPELFQTDGKVSAHSDAWAYGMTVLEVLSGERPYSSEKNDLVVLGLIRDGKTPSRPDHDPHVLGVLDDTIWAICQLCWSASPESRPSMEYVEQIIHECWNFMKYVASGEIITPANGIGLESIQIPDDDTATCDGPSAHQVRRLTNDALDEDTCNVCGGSGRVPATLPSRAAPAVSLGLLITPPPSPPPVHPPEYEKDREKREWFAQLHGFSDVTG